MPGLGQGKHSQKKKRRENALNLNANIAAVNTVLNTDTLIARTDPPANETALKTASYMVPNARTATLTALTPSAVTTTAGLTNETAQENSHTAI